LKGQVLTKNDDVLVEEVRGGRTASFDELMLRYQKLVCKIAMGYVKSRENALDVTQNVFIKVYNHLDAVRAEGMFKPWLLRITYNESINWVRKHKRTAGREELLDSETPFVSTDDPLATVEKRDDQAQVVRGMAALNPKYKLALSLRYAEGLRIREIADVMECSEGMVKSLLFRGVRQIRRNVADSTGSTTGMA
jgi:RNA polymerase sigma-70 factor (ECF subfamily)